MVVSLSEVSPTLLKASLTLEGVASGKRGVLVPSFLVDAIYVGTSDTLDLLIVVVNTASIAVLFAADRVLSMDVPSIT